MSCQNLIVLFICIFIYMMDCDDSVPVVRQPSSDVSVDVGSFPKSNSSRNHDKTRNTIEIPFLGYFGARNDTEELLEQSATNSTQSTQDEAIIIMNSIEDSAHGNVTASSRNETEEQVSLDDVEQSMSDLEAPRRFNPDSNCPAENGDNVFLFAHPQSPHRFYACDNGVAYQFQCPSPLIFNSELEVKLDLHVFSLIGQKRVGHGGIKAREKPSKNHKRPTHVLSLP